MQTTEVPQLRATVRTGPAESPAPEILFATCLPPSQQDRQPSPLAGFAQRPGLLPRTGQRPAGPGLAEGPSGLLAEAAQGPGGPRQGVLRVTRSLRPSYGHASPCSACGYDRLGRQRVTGRVTRCHAHARPYSDWTCLPVNGISVTRRHRPDHPAADTLGPADSRPPKRETKPWA